MPRPRALTLRNASPARWARSCLHPEAGIILPRASGRQKTAGSSVMDVQRRTIRNGQRNEPASDWAPTTSNKRRRRPGGIHLPGWVGLPLRRTLGPLQFPRRGSSSPAWTAGSPRVESPTYHTRRKGVNKDRRLVTSDESIFPGDRVSHAPGGLDREMNRVFESRISFAAVTDFAGPSQHCNPS